MDSSSIFKKDDNGLDFEWGSLKLNVTQLTNELPYTFRSNFKI